MPMPTIARELRPDSPPLRAGGDDSEVSIGPTPTESEAERVKHLREACRWVERARERKYILSSYKRVPRFFRTAVLDSTGIVLTFLLRLLAA